MSDVLRHDMVKEPAGGGAEEKYVFTQEGKRSGAPVTCTRFRNFPIIPEADIPYVLLPVSARDALKRCWDLQVWID